MERGMRIMNKVQHKRIISAVKRVEFVSDRMSYIMLRGRCCHIIVLNIRAQQMLKLERVFDKYDKHHIQILLGDFNAKVGTVYISKLTN
jgi:hypothetical protein